MLLFSKILLCFFICFISLFGCSKSQDNLSKIDKSSIQDIDISKNIEKNYNEFELPEWIGNYFEFGTYEELFRFANEKNYSQIKISNGIQIPESRLLSILFSTPIKSTYLYDDTNENIISFINTLKTLNIEQIDEKSYNQIFKYKDNRKLLFETNIFFINAESKYMGINILTYDNYEHLLKIQQEDKILYGFCESNSFFNLISATTQTKHFDINMVNDIKKVEYLHNNEWLECDQDYLNIFKEAISNSKSILNQSTGCPFELELKITMENNTQFNTKYSTDDCGIIIIEDTILCVKEKYIDLLKIN